MSLTVHFGNCKAHKLDINSLNISQEIKLEEAALATTIYDGLAYSEIKAKVRVSFSI